MTRAARSMYVFGIYGTATGVGFLLAPSVMISLLQLTPLPSGWARTIGLLAIVIGVDDVVAARAECLPFLRASVPLRIGFATGITTLVVTAQLATSTLLFAAFDLVGATWTALALRAHGRGEVSRTESDPSLRSG